MSMVIVSKWPRSPSCFALYAGLRVRTSERSGTYFETTYGPLTRSEPFSVAPAGEPIGTGHVQGTVMRFSNEPTGELRWTVSALPLAVIPETDFPGPSATACETVITLK